MKAQWLWRLLRASRRIWVRATLFSALAIVTALLGIALSPYIPSDIPTKIGADAVDHILGIIASSMLTVTTFSLSVMVSAYSASTSNVTPRATRLVMEDSTTHNVLSTFVGSFMFSLVGIIVLSTGSYGAQGRVVLFGATLVVIALIVGTLLRWIDHLSRLGRVTETTGLVEKAATKAMEERRDHPYLGGTPLESETTIPALAIPIHTHEIGYVQHVDVGALSTLAEDSKGQIFLNAIPGNFVDPTEPIAFAVGLSSENAEEQVRHCYTISDTRSFDQDPRFGISVLAEIGSRALSPAINDPGTAIDVIGRMVRVLSIWATPVENAEPEYPRVFVPAIEVSDLFEDAFTPLARDGASIVEVGLRMQKALATLERMSPERFRASANLHSREALVRARSQLIDVDIRRLEDVGVATRTAEQATL